MFEHQMKNRPTVATDIAIIAKVNGKTCVLLIKRGHDPYKGMMALPGGFMEWGETCEQSATRELMEETGVSDVSLELLGVFSKPGRDPRGTVVSVAYIGLADAEKVQPKAGDDAVEAEWVELEKCPHLAADHDDMIIAIRKHPLLQKV